MSSSQLISRGRSYGRLVLVSTMDSLCRPSTSKAVHRSCNKRVRLNLLSQSSLPYSKTSSMVQVLWEIRVINLLVKRWSTHCKTLRIRFEWRAIRWFVIFTAKKMIKRVRKSLSKISSFNLLHASSKSLRSHEGANLEGKKMQTLRKVHSLLRRLEEPIMEKVRA